MAGVKPEFFAYLVRAMGFTGFIDSLAKGIRERSTDFRWNNFGALRLPVPPYEEQQKIAHFLDYQTAKIDQLIEKQKRLIELLEEKRQAVISQIVTKGLDLNVSMKDSGVEWLGQVPTHWTVKPLKQIAQVDSSGTYGVDVDNSQFLRPVATTAQIGKDGSFAVERMPQRGFQVSD